MRLKLIGRRLTRLVRQIRPGTSWPQQGVRSNLHHPSQIFKIWLLIKRGLAIGKVVGSPLRTNMIELCKSNAAKRAVDDHIETDCVIGIGSGTTIEYVLKHLRHRCQEYNLKVKCIPTSFQSKQLIYDFDMPMTDLDANPMIDVTIDGADEVDENFVAIKGGGGCLAQEKVIAFAAKKFIIVADHRKNSKRLGENWKKGIPIEILPMACTAVRHQIAKRFDVNLKDLNVRLGKEKAGPVVTDNGNFIVDWKFRPDHNRNLIDWKNLSDEVKLIPGVVETGIFAGMAEAVYFGQKDGVVLKRENTRNGTH